MTRAEMLAELREDVLHDNASPYLWGDLTLTSYLSEGQDKFCEDTGYFIDTTNYTLTLETDKAVYDIPDRVIQIMEVWDGNRRLEKALTGRDGNEVSAAGAPAEWFTDKDTGVIKFSPVPTSEQSGNTLTLQVWRYSQNELSGFADDGTSPAVPELPGRLQRACIEWAAFRAYMSHDADKQDKVKAADHLATYKMYKNDGIAAMRRFHNIEARVGTARAYRT